MIFDFLQNKRWAMILRIAVILAAAFLLLYILMPFVEHRILYHPTRVSSYTGDPTAGTAGPIQEVTYTTSNGTKRTSPWAPREETDRTILWFHGNGGNAGDRIPDMKRLHRQGHQVLIGEYRGYGMNDGTPSEEGLYRDAESAWTFLTEEKDIPPNQIIIMGRSLGAAVATHLAAKERDAGLILVSPFTSIADMAYHKVPIPGLSLLLQSRFDSSSRIKDIHAPLLVMHGTRDRVVPFELGKTLFEQAVEPKSFIRLRDAGHNNIASVAGDLYFDSIDTFVREHTPTSP